MNVGSLFSGIGGFDLGLERAGMRTVWFCEQEPYRQRVLARHWPGVPIHSDVRSLVADARSVGQAGTAESNGSAKVARRCGGWMSVSVSPVDVLCGGFPCQDLSLAGKGAGIDGTRSGLWSEFARLIGELRPRYVIVENVPAIAARGLGRVLGDLAACGYDAEWDCIPASALGAPHRRDRIWIIAYPGSQSRGLAEHRGCGSGGQSADAPKPALVQQGDGAGRAERLAPCNRAGDVALAWGANDGRPLHNPLHGRHGVPEGQVPAGRDGTLDASGWSTEPDVGRVADGVPSRVDRLAALGDALVPQIAEWIGRRILAYERERVIA